VHSKVSQLLFALGVLFGAAGCQLVGLGETNALENPGFEGGREGWSWRENSRHWSDFSITGDPVRSGRQAVHLELRHGPSDPQRSTGIYGVVQELGPEIVPERVGGWYRVERWEKGAPRAALYLQVVAIVWGDPRTPRIVSPDNPPLKLENFQLRYYLAGAERTVFSLLNARILFLGRQRMPTLGEWVHFEIALREDIERHWGVRPEGHDFIRLLFEARWDRLPAGATVNADVYFDDLYAIH